MPETWPVSLPQFFLIGSYSTGFGDGRIRSDNEYGPAKVRRRTSSSVRPLSGEMVMTQAQLEIFETFVNTTIMGGVLPFTFPSQIGGSALLVRFGENLPSWSRYGADRWLATFELEIMP